MQRNRILYIVYEPGNVQVGFQLARCGQARSDFDVILWSPYSLPEAERYKSEAMAAGAVYVDETTPAGGLADIFTPLSGWLSAKPARLPVAQKEPTSTQRSLRAAVDYLPNEVRLEVLRGADQIERRIRFCEDWLVRLGVDAVVLAEDNIERDSYAWVWAAKRRGIRSIVVTYGALSEQEAVRAYRHSVAHAVPITQAQWVCQHMPRWLAKGPDYAITRLPWMQALAHEVAGTAPFNPWLVNSGAVDTVALESGAMADAYSAHGFDRARLKAIGHPLQDTLAKVCLARQARKDALCDKHGLPKARKLVMVAMPPNQLPTQTGVYSHYDQIVHAFACIPMERLGWSVIVSPHPNCSGDDHARIKATGAVLEQTPVAELLPLGDLYIACVSSTIKWALGCGIPVINYDCYGYDYPDYLSLPQVIAAYDERAFIAALDRFSDEGEHAQLVAHAKANASYWGLFDGQAIDRLIELCFERTVNEHPN